MAFRTIFIEKAVSVRLDLNNIVVNYENDKYWINIDEISVIIVEDPRCNISLNLLSYLCEKNICMILCDGSHMPIGTLQTLNSHSRSSKRIKQQLTWDSNTMDYLWTNIVKAKIKNQIHTLEVNSKSNKIDTLNNLLSNVEFGDISNREGTASRVYFKELFGNDFKRFNDDLVNYALNYIYQIIRSKISQEIVSLGYLPSYGIHHKSEFNSFNLADDLIEPFRPICDYYVHEVLKNYDGDYLNSEIKYKIVDILNTYILYGESKYKLHASIQFYVQNMVAFLEDGDISRIIFPKLL